MSKLVIRDDLMRATAHCSWSCSPESACTGCRALAEEFAYFRVWLADARAALAASEERAERLEKALRQAMSWGIEMGTADPAWVASARAALAQGREVTG